MLLAYGADVHRPDHWGQSALHCVIWCCGNLECVKLLLEAGADVSAINSGGCTSLSLAAMFGRTQTLDHLLTCHADPTIPDCDGFTPLFFSLKENSHEALQILLQRRRTVTGHKMSNGRSLLHVTAYYGDFETVEILQNAGIVRLDIDAQDDVGLTAREIMQWRVKRGEASAEEGDNFDALLDSVEKRFEELGEDQMLSDDDDVLSEDDDGEETDNMLSDEDEENDQMRDDIPSDEDNDEDAYFSACE